MSYSRGDLGRRLADGKYIEAFVSRLLDAEGIPHRLTATAILRPPGARPEEYADVDLVLWDRTGAERLVSIKSSREAFTGPADFPYPDCLLMSVQAGQDPDAYWATIRVSVHPDTPFGIVIAPHTRIFRRQQSDRERGGYLAACVLREDLRTWDAFMMALARQAVSA